jgi:hypothetical protein
MRGLVRATHYYATQQARSDWAQLAEYAAANGYSDKADALQPPVGAGHRTIDKRIDALMHAMGMTIPFYEWQNAQRKAD